MIRDSVRWAEGWLAPALAQQSVGSQAVGAVPPQAP
jgi:hypothetical protein